MYHYTPVDEFDIRAAPICGSDSDQFSMNINIIKESRERGVQVCQPCIDIHDAAEMFMDYMKVTYTGHAMQVVDYGYDAEDGYCGTCGSGIYSCECGYTGCIYDNYPDARFHKINGIVED